MFLLTQINWQILGIIKYLLLRLMIKKKILNEDVRINLIIYTIDRIHYFSAEMKN